MQTFTLLYFQDSVLARTERIRAQDVLEAIERVSGTPQHLRVEIWHGGRRVADVGLALG